MGHPIHKHMHTHITKQNVEAAIRDDKAHMDYLKRDIKDDQKFHVADKDARQTHDEQHISNLAQDVKHDEKKEGLSRMQSPLNVGPDPLGKQNTAKKQYSFGEKLIGTAKNIGDYATSKIKGSKVLDGIGVTNPYGLGFIKEENQAASQAASARAKQRVDEGSSFFRASSKGSPARNMDHGKMKGKELHNHMMVHHPAKPPTSRNESESQEIHNLNYINPVVKRGTKK